MWLQPLSAALGPHFAWSHAKNLVSQVHLHLVDGRLPEPSRAVRFSSDQSSSVDVQDLFEDQRRMPVPQLAAGLSNVARAQTNSRIKPLRAKNEKGAY
jgi:hypothetical protein